ncbi:hypothetical protein [Spirosoma sordidisoli]|uniref:Uncharacterized protein n=1 Tax=Spirosoma sordidisoli TaxID=2502893 RepID=A0A4Q2UTE3_9BACT|nr:hypothetical protein [Spirosoma sordidisoli]RYC70079.1 hypothetical protein EQG79_09415 [Spirosoma sordidisoli]
MQRFILSFASLAVIVFVYAFATIAVSLVAVSCQQTEVATVFTGYGNSDFESFNDEQDGGFQLVGNLCYEQPQDITLSVWYFDPDTDPATALRTVTLPGLDEDGEPTEADVPDDSFAIQVAFTNQEGRKGSHFSPSGFFTGYLDSGKLAVVEVLDVKTGRMMYKTINTANGLKLETCFSF